MLIPFNKYQGTGNDFIIIDNREGYIQLTTEQIKKLCDRKFGVGADGLMFVERSNNFDFKMLYYNSDGNESSMCGNGGRCISLFAHTLGLGNNNKVTFTAIDGPHEAIIYEGEQVSLKMKDVKKIDFENGDYFLNTGSPHYIKIVNNVESIDVYDEGKKIRYSDKYKEAGTNVNFVSYNDDAIFVRTYERGVENETLSCGTGVTAAALVLNSLGFSGKKNKINVITKGGDLEVSFDKVLEDTYYNIWLKGPAQFVFRGEINLFI
ncbi:MAG: diaminopimelate epimerase [Bacteroidetes bacterium]|nr:diaminopimelate epimerase [Bacteroidota bacterium]